MELTSDTFEYHQGLGCDVTFVRALARIQGLEKRSYEAFCKSVAGLLGEEYGAKGVGFVEAERGGEGVAERV